MCNCDIPDKDFLPCSSSGQPLPPWWLFGLQPDHPSHKLSRIVHSKSRMRNEWIRTLKMYKHALLIIQYKIIIIMQNAFLFTVKRHFLLDFYLWELRYGGHNIWSHRFVSHYICLDHAHFYHAYIKRASAFFFPRPISAWARGYISVCCFLSSLQGGHGLKKKTKQSHHQLDDLRRWKTLVEERSTVYNYAWYPLFAHARNYVGRTYRVWRHAYIA